MSASAIFKSAILLPAGERSAYVDKLCGEDAALRLEVEALLRAQEQPGPFQHRPPIADAATVDAPGPERPGMRIGPYKLLQFLGEGGMGTVFLAEQTEPVRRMVALKIIKPGMDSRHVLARFEAERQALALMDHPNIARVLDAGTTSEKDEGGRMKDESAVMAGSPSARASGQEGRPYFVMELVKGLPITEFCDKNKLTPRQRLELFVPVCMAIQHAHMKGIIHRDIKPSNVLVALYDGKPVPKVIDFGVAKAMAEPLTKRTLFTQMGQVVGTLQYMSPEQATLNQLDVDTRSDIYSLGVLLYELLTGTTPIDKDQIIARPFDQMLRAIREDEPMRPSARLTSDPGALASAAMYRGTASNTLTDLLRGELDWIVMKCLEKERERRYVTAGSLADDIHRFLRDEPVVACPPTLGYRLRKLYRKHRPVVLGAATLAAVLLTATVVSVAFAVSANRARNDALEAQAVADKERKDAANKRDEATKQRDEARDANEKLRQARQQQLADQYAWDMRILPLSFEAGNVAETRRFLDRQPPELRGFEWRYWKRKLHAEIRSEPLPGAPTQVPGDFTYWHNSADGSRLACVQWPMLLKAPKEKFITLKVWDVGTRRIVLDRRVDIPRPADSNLASSLTSAGAPTLSATGKYLLLSYTVRPTSFEADLKKQRLSQKEVCQIFEVATGKLLFESIGPGSENFLSRKAAFSFSRDESWFIVVRPAAKVDDTDWARRVVVFDLRRGNESSWSLPTPAAEDVPMFKVPPGVGKGPPSSRWANEVVLSPCGRYLGRIDQGPKASWKISVWEAQTGKHARSWDSPGVRKLAFSPDGDWLAGITYDPQDKEGPKDVNAPTIPVFISLWSTLNGRTRYTNRVDLNSEGGVSRSLQFSPDGSRLGVACGSRDGHILDAMTGAVVSRLDGRGFGGEFSPDGKLFAAANGPLLHVWDTSSGLVLLTFRGHEFGILQYGFTPDGARIWSMDAAGVLKEWSLRDSDSVAIASISARTRSSPVAALTASPAPGFVAIQQWLEVDGKPTHRVVHIRDTAGNLLRTLKVPAMNAASEPFVRFNHGASRLDWSEDGRRVVLTQDPTLGFTKKSTASPGMSDLTMWDAQSGEKLFHREEEVLFQMPKGPEVPKIDPVVKGFGPAAISPDGSLVAAAARGSGGHGKIVRLFDVRTGQERHLRLQVDAQTNISWLSFAPRGNLLAAGVVYLGAIEKGRTGRTVVWDVQREDPLYHIEFISKVDDIFGFGPFGFRRSGPPRVAWRADGARFAGVEEDHIAVHDARTGKALVRTDPLTNEPGSLHVSTRLAFSPDGKRIAAHLDAQFRGSPLPGQANVPRADLKLWDADTGKELLSTSLNSAFVLGMSFSSDGHRLHVLDRRGEEGADAAPAQRVENIILTTLDAAPLPVLRK